MEMSKIDTASAQPFVGDEGNPGHPVFLGAMLLLVALPWLLVRLLAETARRYATSLVGLLDIVGTEWHRARNAARHR